MFQHPVILKDCTNTYVRTDSIAPYKFGCVKIEQAENFVCHVQHFLSAVTQFCLFYSTVFLKVVSDGKR